MAERRIFTEICTKDETVGSGSAGGTYASDTIDLRGHCITGDLSIAYKITTAGAAATCASSKISIVGCNVFSKEVGDFIAPTGGTCATLGDTGGTDIISLSSLPAMPFVKILVVAGSSGTAKISSLALHAR